MASFSGKFDEKTITEEISNFIKKVPDGLREFAPIIVDKSEEILKQFLYFKQFKTLQNIYTYSGSNLKARGEKADKWIEDAGKIKVVAQNKVPFSKCLKSNEACPETVRQELKDAMNTIANKILILGLITGCISAAIDGYNICEFWKQIKDADNLVERSPGKRQEISEQLSYIQPLMTKLDKAYADLIRSDIVQDDFECAKAAVEYYSKKIEKKVGKFLNDINELKFEVNGKMEKLKSARDNAIASSITGGASAGAAVSYAILLRPYATPILTCVTIALGVIRAAIIAKNVHLFVISSETLKKLQKEVDEIVKVRDMGLKIQGDVNEIIEDMNMRLLNSKFDFSKYD